MLKLDLLGREGALSPKKGILMINTGQLIRGHQHTQTTLITILGNGPVLYANSASSHSH